MIKIFKGKNSGSSLIELLLYMAILAVLLTVLTSIFVSALDVQLESKASSAVGQDGNYILSKLAYDIHRAQSITLPSYKGLPAVNNFQIVINSINYTYSIDSNSNLVLSDSLGSSNTLNSYNSSISNFTAQRLGNVSGVEDTLKINYTVASRIKRVSGIEPARIFQTTLSLRRK